MRRAAANGDSPNRITLLRDADGDGVAEISERFLENLSQPYGMALKGETLYVGNTDALVSFPYKTGETRITAAPTHHLAIKTHGHWTRNLLLSRDETKLYVAVGSQGNIDENGDEAEAGRACIYEFDLATGQHRIYASGLRNPVGMAFEPATNTLFTVVNERDGLGDEVPPDYLTSVKDGGFYGWPWAYWGIVDDRARPNPEMAAKALVPDYALGGHTASLGLCWVPAGTLPGFGEGMAIGQHGSWNRSKLSGYKMVFVEFKDGKPAGTPPRDILTGFLAPDEKFSYGRPVGVCVGPDKKSLLMADDVGDVIWRVTGA
jgi:glucose/arabinose dehydrogenase